MLLQKKVKRRALFSLWLPLLPGPSSVLPPHWLLNFRCPFSRVQPLGESWEFSAPVHWNMWSGCFAAGTTEIKPTSQHLAPCRRGPRDAAVLWKDTCESSRPPQPAVRTMRLGGSLEHKAVQIIWKPQHHGISLQVLQSKKKKKDSTSLTVQKLDDKSLVVVWIIPEQVTEGLLCSTPKAISQSVSYPHLIFSPQFLAFFFKVSWSPRDTGHLRGRIQECVVSVVSGVCQAWADGKFLRFLTFSLFPSSLAVFQNGLVCGSFSPQSKISHILQGRCHLLVLLMITDIFRKLFLDFFFFFPFLAT